MKLKYKDIPSTKAKLADEQGWVCPICQRSLLDLKKRDQCLDHNHVTGEIRAVLCRGCNSMEGKVYRAFIRVGLKNQGVDYGMFLDGLKEYYYTWDRPNISNPDRTIYIHPKHKEKKK